MSIYAYKLILIILGFISLILSIIGIVIPILPTTPFLLLSAFCFFKGSKKLDLWFKNTALYKKHVDTFIENKEMDLKSKTSTILTLTILFSIGFFFAKNLIVVRIILAIIWIIHILYFTLYIKTKREL
ncbi:MAG: YbaN family protein [Sphaerochaetaceae bacterium]|nr:YbaN family protein [Sphaerochaetaceae bacterium]MDC7236517.1 YbaN family protein [Sphaerochaetaceae bacterium]MDC7249555.1 YbaN family protein [Sphaerochaetaceae bacterium]